MIKSDTCVVSHARLDSKISNFNALFRPQIYEVMLSQRVAVLVTSWTEKQLHAQAQILQDFKILEFIWMEAIAKGFGPQIVNVKSSINIYH